MRHFYFIFLFFCFISCKTKKRVIAEKATQETILTATKTIDSLIEIEEETEKKVSKDSLKMEDFNQVLTERTFKPHELWDKLLQKNVSNNGNVNYKGFLKDRKDLYGYIHILSLIVQDENFNSLSKEQKLTFWINAYNAFTIDLILRHYPIKSIKDIKNPWKQRHWKLGNKWYNLDEIEHNILRKMDEPRIHFAINCASVSCPKLQNKAFSSKNLYEQLTKATREFLADLEKNNLSDNPIKLSKIFKWFSEDFEKKGTLIQFLNTYSKETVYSSTKIKFMNYNWGLNE